MTISIHTIIHNMLLLPCLQQYRSRFPHQLALGQLLDQEAAQQHPYVHYMLQGRLHYTHPVRM